MNKIWILQTIQELYETVQIAVGPKKDSLTLNDLKTGTIRYKLA